MKFFKIVIINLLINIFFCFSLHTEEYELLDKIIVSVEKDVITQREIDKEISKKIKNLNLKSLSSLDNKKILDDVTKFLIEKKLILQYADNLKIIPTQQDINIMTKNILDNNNITIGDLENKLIEDGSSIIEFQDDLKFNLIVQRIKDREIMPYINISEFEIDALIDKSKDYKNSQFKLTHILVKSNNPNKNEIITKIQNLKTRDDFSILAKNYSDGPNSEQFGDLGWKKVDELPEIFSSFLSTGKEGEISKAIESSNGTHFLRIESINKSKKNAQVIVRQYKFQQIILKHNEISNDDDLQKKLITIKNLIDDGLLFSDAVKKYSDDQFNIDPNKLEWVSINNLLPEFKIKLSEYPTKKLIGPFKTELGWHLIKVYNYRENDITDEAEREKAKISIARNKTEIRFNDWINALVKNSKIKYFYND